MPAPPAIIAACQQVERTGQIDKDGNRTYTAKFHLETSAAAVTQEDIFAEIAAGGSGLPWIGNPFSITAACDRVVSLDLQTRDRLPGKKWVLTATYSTRGDRPPTADPNPLNRLADVRFDLNQFRRAVDKTAYGNPIKNSAGDAVPRERDDDNGVIRIVQNRPGPGQSVPWIWKNELDQYLKSLNEADFTILANTFPAETLRMLSIVPELRYESCVWYWSVVYTIEYRQDGWEDTFYDSGFRKLVDGRQVAIVDPNGNPGPQGYYLDGAGNRLAAAASPVELSFSHYLPVSWTGLAFNLSIP
ncbi:MAG: hypothetical protein K1X74_22980 [Pirellulales bacterium]|nr:hypothetical protein [Pirellulales bacterium]